MQNTYAFISPLGMPRRRWMDNIKMDLKEAGRGVNWMGVTHDRDKLRTVVNAVKNFGGSIKCGEFTDQLRPAWLFQN